MARLKAGEVPAMRLHATGQWVVSLSGRDHYLGRDEDGARSRCDELVGRWLANGRRAMRPRDRGPTVAGLAEAFLEHARIYYRKRGRLTSYGHVCELVMGDWVSLYGGEPAAGTGAVEVKTLRAHWTRRGAARSTVNKYAGVVRNALAWAVNEGLVPEEAHRRVALVPALKRGRSEARETPRRKTPPSREAVEAVLDWLENGRDSAAFGRVAASMRPRQVLYYGRSCRTVAAMVRLQLLTGARPGEVCGLRLGDLDRSGDVWLYRVRPEVHKLDHREETPDRVLPVGPRAQAVLGPFLGRCLGRRLTPARERERAGLPVFPTKNGRPLNPATYRRLVRQACDKMAVPRFSVNTLRHFRATEVRAMYDLETAQQVLGHTSKITTERFYASLPLGKAIQAARESG